MGGASAERRTSARPRARRRRPTASRITEALGVDAFDGDAHALLVAIYKDPAQPIALRLDAAKAAISFEKPRLAALKADVSSRMTLEELVLGSFKHEEPSGHAEASRPRK